jgi:hypothetical protein
MRYQITGRFIAPDLMRLPREEFIKLLHSKLVPSLRVLANPNPHGEVLAGGFIAGSRDLVLTVDLKAHGSHRIVRDFLSSLPIIDYYEWQVTPLESFEEALQQFEQV